MAAPRRGRRVPAHGPFRRGAHAGWSGLSRGVDGFSVRRTLRHSTDSSGDSIGGVEDAIRGHRGGTSDLGTDFEGCSERNHHALSEELTQSAIRPRTLR